MLICVSHVFRPSGRIAGILGLKSHLRNSRKNVADIVQTQRKWSLAQGGSLQGRFGREANITASWQMENERVSEEGGGRERIEGGSWEGLCGGGGGDLAGQRLVSQKSWMKRCKIHNYVGNMHQQSSLMKYYLKKVPVLLLRYLGNTLLRLPISLCDRATKKSIHHAHNSLGCNLAAWLVFLRCSLVFLLSWKKVCSSC